MSIVQNFYGQFKVVFEVLMWYNLRMELERYRKAVYEDLEEKFLKLYNMLTEYNNMYNLTAICDKDGVFCKHFLDSVAGESYIPDGACVAEIGSGGGFPSIPLKILRDDLKFTLIESTGKKCNYLNAVVDNFGFGGVQVRNIRAEDGARDPGMREKYDAAIARAVARLNTLCEYCLPYVKVGGVFIAWKGCVDEELAEAERAVKVLGGKLKHVEKYSLPNGDMRSLVVIEKAAPTPSRYPRGNGKERKNPIR